MKTKPVPPLPDFVKAEIAGLHADGVIAMINALKPEVRAEVVFALFATHVEDAHKEGELPAVIGDSLEALAIGIFTIEPNGVTRWRSTHDTTHPKAADTAELLEILDTSVAAAINGLAAKFGAVDLKRSKGPPS